CIREESGLWRASWRTLARETGLNATSLSTSWTTHRSRTGTLSSRASLTPLPKTPWSLPRRCPMPKLRQMIVTLPVTRTNRGVDPARSHQMSLVRAKDTRPEMVVRQLVHRCGRRFRLHRKDLPGTPDLVFPRSHQVIFVHGCFWHQHGDPDCWRS